MNSGVRVPLAKVYTRNRLLRAIVRHSLLVLPLLPKEENESVRCPERGMEWFRR
jgi:hypothetical protein